MSKTVNRQISAAIDATKREDYLLALTQFLEAYGSEDVAAIGTAKAATGLSFFGLCLALVQKKFKPAIELARRALDLEFYNPEHTINLSRIYVAAGNRKKALETIEAGLKLMPEDEALIAARKELGVRARPSVPFLTRSHPINVSLGQARHAKKVAEKEKKK